MNALILRFHLSVFSFDRDLSLVVPVAHRCDRRYCKSGSAHIDTANTLGRGLLRRWGRQRQIHNDSNCISRARIRGRLVDGDTSRGNHHEDLQKQQRLPVSLARLLLLYFLVLALESVPVLTCYASIHILLLHVVKLNSQRWMANFRN